MRPETFWERFGRHFIWGQWSAFTRPIFRKYGKDRVFVISKLKIIWRLK